MQNMEGNRDSIVDVRSVVEAISIDDIDTPLYQVESPCMRCGENGITRFLLTLIPHFRKMLNRQVVKSETAIIKVEGILVRAADELEGLQYERKEMDPQAAEAIDHFLLKLKACAAGESSFTFILDDPAGNSFIENPWVNLVMKHHQTEEVIFLIKLEHHMDQLEQRNSAEISETLFRYSAPEEVMTFPSTCGACAVRCETRMFITEIPYFQEVVVMASSCDACGYRNSKLKPGGRIPEKGKKITVFVKNINDLCRDVIKVLREYMDLLLEIALTIVRKASGKTSDQGLTSF